MLLTELSGLDWVEDRFDIYALRYYPSFGGSDPLVIPVGGRGFQQLKVITRNGDSWTTTEEVGCTFVPLVGKHGWSEGEK